MNRIIDIANDGYHLARQRGFLTLSHDHTEMARVALDDIAAIIVHAHGVTYSNSLLVELASRGSILVLCGANHFPMAYLGAISGHHAQSKRTTDQIRATRPLIKQLWKIIVTHKIQMQSAALNATGQPDHRLNILARDVKSGDPTNIEAQAARHYWSRMMGPEFTRDRDADGANAMLNYGYTVLRAAVARAVIAAGLHPAIGIHHHSQINSFALADDLIEPFRPLIDYTVKSLIDHGTTSVDANAKRALAAVLDFDLKLDDTRSPVTTAIQSLCLSLVTSYAGGRAHLNLPAIPPPIDFAQLGGLNETE